MPLIDIGDYQEFNYTGSIQTFKSNLEGIYKFEVYGAQGGKGSASSAQGGKGGYSVGYKYLTANEELYVVVGQQGGQGRGGYNGGGNDTIGTAYTAGGGGATHIAKISGLLSTLNNHKDSILIVAGGGGGSRDYSAGGTGGGTSGGKGAGGGGAAGGTQTSGNAFGQGEAGYGGGGGGYYGGYSTIGNDGGGGGSGYIGGVPPVVFDGITYIPSTENGQRNGNGYAKITLIGTITITIEYDSSLGNASHEYQGNNVILIATPFDNAQFKGWYIGDTLISRDLQTTYEVNEDTTFEARFTPKYSISLDFDSNVGNATFTRDADEQNIIYLSVDSTITQFNGWYINDTLISYNQQAQYQITQNSIIEARFEPIWEIDDSVEGDGSIQYSRQDTNLNIVTFTVIPDANRHFVKYVIDGVDEFETPITLTLTSDLTIVAIFEEDDKYHITASANIKHTSVYVSHNDVYAGYTATLWARPFPNYVFEKWSDGETENPRTITVTEDVTLVAEFNHVIETNGIYQYRCFIKDQLNMTDKPKAFMVVDKFTLKQDYLTNANSTIEVLKMASDVNNGDVIVVYNPKGETIYQGVITSISDTKITTSQMQSFYKGMWIYNNYSSAQYVEQEVAYLLGQYAQGKIYGSTYVDPLIAERLGGITIRNTNSISGNLPTDLDKDGNPQYTQWDMEKFIYKLYQDYGIVFEFTINMSGANYVDIKVPTYSSLSIGNNHYAIMNLSPMQTIEENNKLIIYWNSTVAGQHQAKQYRTTYVATKNGIVEAPVSTANRFNITNTIVVFSDDNVADLVAANLPNTMYNHKITFDLLLKNNLYQFGEFKLGMPLTIWYNGTDYYDSVLTGRTFTKQSNQNVSVVSYTCGLVRTTLTKKLTLNRA